MTYIILIAFVTISCNKETLPSAPPGKRPTVLLVSTEALLLDTVWSAPKRYMNFLITFDVIVGDSDLYFAQIPPEYQSLINILGSDTVHIHTVFTPMILTNIPEVIPETGIYKLRAGDTTRLSYYVMMIAHGPWTDFYAEAYSFAYSWGMNDGTYESRIEFEPPFKTNKPQ